MKKYLFKEYNGDLKILFGYDEHKMLRIFEGSGIISEKQLEILQRHLPWYESQFEVIEVLLKGKITPVIENISFADFWDAYNYKVGNKARSEKLFNLLTDIEKALAIRMIKTYDNFLVQKRTQEKLYPETYLSQRRFENNYKIS